MPQLWLYFLATQMWMRDLFVVTNRSHFRWIYGVNLRDKLPCVELRQWLGTEDIVSGPKKSIAMLWTCFKTG